MDSDYKPYCECGKKAGRNGKCESCGMSERKASKQALAEPKKRKAIKPRSEKRIKEDADYSVLRKEQLEEHPECQVVIMNVCVGEATTVHHTEKRGKNYLKKESYLSACMPCHDFLETRMSAVERRDLGLLK